MHSELMNYHQLVPFMGKTLGSMYSVVLFEYSNDAFHLVSYHNIETISIQMLQEYVSEHKEENVINDSIQFDFSKLDRISVQYIKDTHDQLIGAFCITMKCMPIIKIEGLLQELLNLNIPDPISTKEYPKTLEGIDEYIQDYNYAGEKPNKDERLEMILDLYDLGMFNIKGAIAHVADRLFMSTKSVYRYVSTIKQNREE